MSRSPSGSDHDDSIAARMRERLDRIERTLGVLVLDGMPHEVEVAILEAWWDSRFEVPDDDPLRVATLEERREYARQMGVLDV